MQLLDAKKLVSNLTIMNFHNYLIVSIYCLYINDLEGICRIVVEIGLRNGSYVLKSYNENGKKWNFYCIFKVFGVSSIYEV